MSVPGLLDGKVVLVSGSGPGLGRSCAKAVLAGGGFVALGDIDPTHAEAVAAELDPDGSRSITRAMDVTDVATIDGMTAAIRERWGRLDGLVNVAALDTPVGGLLEGGLDEWERVATINLRGTLQVTRAAVELMDQGGSIVMIGTIGTVRPRPGALRMAYGASKGALATAAHYLATELGAHGIRVNTVAPGWKWGPVLAGYVEGVSAETGVPVDDLLERFRADSPMHEIADDDDVAATVAYFLSELSKRVSGQTVYVDAGSYLH